MNNKVINVPLEVIAQAVAEHFGITEKELFARTRKRDYTERRFIFFALAKEFNKLNVTFSGIGEYCRDYYNIPEYNHATVLYGSQKTDVLNDIDPSFRRSYNMIKEKVEDWLVVNRNYDLEFQKFKSELIRKIKEANSKEELNDIYCEV